MVSPSNSFGAAPVNAFGINPNQTTDPAKAAQMPNNNLNAMLSSVFQQGGLFSAGQGSPLGARQAGSQLAGLYSGMGLGSILTGVLGSEQDMQQTLGGILSASFGGSPTEASSGVIEGLLQGGAGIPTNSSSSSLLGSFRDDVTRGGGLLGAVMRQTGKSDALIPSLQSTPFGDVPIFGGIESTMRMLMQSLH